MKCRYEISKVEAKEEEKYGLRHDSSLINAHPENIRSVRHLIP